MRRGLGIALVVTGLAAGACTWVAGGGAKGPPAAGTSMGLVVVDSTLGGQGEAAGTGIVLTPSGEVLTNNHVIAGATSVRVDAGNGHSYPATVVGYDRTRDLALLDAQGASALPVASLAPRAAPAVGDPVTAIGNAGGTGTLTAAPGRVSGVNQSITATDQASGSSEQLSGLIAVVANVRPGDSGGALENAGGRVIGVVTAASTGFHFQQGTQEGFAIPIGAALPVGRQIEAGKSSDTVHIGPTAQLGVLVGSSGSAPGALVVGVVPGAPAQGAGIGDGDAITSLGGMPVDSPTTLTTLIDRYRPGQSTEVGWTDPAGATHSATVVLGSGPAG
jgi:S1-C subfamily serine protease